MELVGEKSRERNGNFLGVLFVKKVLFPLLGAMYLGLTTIGGRVYRFLYEEETKEGISIEMCRPWERRRGSYPYQNPLR